MQSLKGSLKIILILGFSASLIFGAGESAPLSIPSDSVSAAVMAPQDSFSLKVTDHLIMSSNNDPNDVAAPATRLFMHEDTIRGEYGQFNGLLNFTNHYTPDGDTTHNALFRLEKKTLALENENWDVKMGDSHQEFGRGIALSLYNDSAFGIDNTLEGASVRYRDDTVDTKFIGGRVNSLRSPVAINAQPDPLQFKDVYIAGEETKVRVLGTTKVGEHYLMTMDQPFPSTRFDEERQTFGAMLMDENLFNTFDFYSESNYLNTEDLNPNQLQAPGYASYASLSWAPNPWKIKLEGKDYRNYNYDWERPPTLEEDIVLENNFNNVSAGRLIVEHRLGDSGTSNLYSSFLKGYDRNDNASLNHSVIGAKFPIYLGEKIDTEWRAGYRWEPGVANLVHGLIKAKMRTGKGQALEAMYAKQFWHLDLNTATPGMLEKNQFMVGYIFNERFAVSAQYEYIPEQTSDLPAGGKNFYNAGATYKMSSLSTRVFAGQTSGGIQCNGGVCRNVPAYTGAYVESSYTF